MLDLETVHGPSGRRFTARLVDAGEIIWYYYAFVFLGMNAFFQAVNVYGRAMEPLMFFGQYEIRNSENPSLRFQPW